MKILSNKDFFIGKKRLNNKVVIVILVLVEVALLFYIFFLVFNKKHLAVSYPSLPERITEKEWETQGELVSGDSNVLGSKSINQVMFYDNRGVTLGTNLDENLKPQINITVDGKTTSKSVPTFMNATKTLGDVDTFFVNGWMKFIDFISAILDKIIS